MAHSFVSLAEARRICKDAAVHHLWLDERYCMRFVEPGWEELQPHVDGAVLFLRRRRSPWPLRLPQA